MAALAVLSLGFASAANAAECCADSGECGSDVAACAEQQLLPYLRTQQGLASDDLVAAKNAASGASKELGSKECCIGESACCAVEFEAATAIADATDLAAARLAFKDWSDALMAKVDEHGVSHGVVYKMHCPMAFGNAGAAWLQDATAVRNPYYGASMLTCGRQVSAIQGDAAPGAHVH